MTWTGSTQGSLEAGTGFFMATYLWCSWGQEGGTILSQCYIVKHVLSQLGEQAVLGLMSWQLLQQVLNQAVPLLALVDQGSQLGLESGTHGKG